MNPFAFLADLLLAFLSPVRCLLCDEPAEDGLCPKCRKQLPKHPFTHTLVLAKGREIPIVVPLPYEGKWKEQILRFKFRNRPELARPLGSLMAAAARELPGSFDGVAYVPLHKKDLQKRDYDQSRLLARQVGRELSLPTLRLLEKCRKTETQHHLNRAQRLQNPKGAYRASPSAAGRSLLLIDDIITTGATLAACSQALYAAGAKRICILCAAESLQNEVQPHWPPTRPPAP